MRDAPERSVTRSPTPKTPSRSNASATVTPSAGDSPLKVHVMRGVGRSGVTLGEATPAKKGRD
ncbi:hypothetical protein [Lentzea aerocolonigenes]|uniref:hypothetical protein n=1 Tax=Lentzea aerocolonigenes TaxID=68170 RepID=UPI0004C44A72|nr:hypothetical protein [Lentzea aerocolonigenes]MCP2243474.1 hypothetical protein [Lentzea aerocolonigenes]